MSWTLKSLDHENFPLIQIGDGVLVYREKLWDRMAWLFVNAMVHRWP